MGSGNDTGIFEHWADCPRRARAHLRCTCSEKGLEEDVAEMRARAAAEREATKKDEGAKRRRKAKLDTECACNAMLVAKMERERDELAKKIRSE